MNPTTVVLNALQRIPAPVRRWLLVAWALAVVSYGALQVLGVDHIGAVALDKVNDLLLYVGGYLGVQSAANVAPAPTDTQDDGDESELDD